MKQTLRLCADHAADVERAAQLLRGDGLVAFPTETVYGLGARGLAPRAVARIFEAKGRPPDNPLILHVTTFADALPLWQADAAALSRAEAVARHFWPGPVTIVLPASALVPEIVRAGLAKVAVRAPAHAAARALLAAVGEPLAAPSANRSGRPSPTHAADVLATLDGFIDAVLDGGPTSVGVESTVVDLSQVPAVVLRPGMVGDEALAAVLGAVQVRAPGQAAHVDAPASPGLRHRHYAPAIDEVVLVEGAQLASVLRPDDAVLATHVTALPAGHRGAREVLPGEPAGYARELFAALYRLERAAPARLVIVAPGARDEARWRAVFDRLLRAVDRDIGG